MKSYPTLAEAFSEERSLIDVLLDEQRRLTAVERFARKHDAHERPAQEQFYRDLIPLTKPATGEQYAFEVDLDACTGCKACVTACHALNGLDDEETWRSVGTLLGGTPQAPVMHTVTTACHHCVDPGCLNGCPVEAYEKDVATGIVRHLDDQCIGCQYCVLKCPYDVPRYSERLGIVRKCDMCHSRLAVGEAPACVQACPNGAITIRIVNQAEVAEEAEVRFALPDAPDSTLTLPATRYVTARAQPEKLKAGDHYQLAPAQAHPPLVWMLVLTQLSLGGFLFDLVARLWLPGVSVKLTSALALAACWLGLFASVLHLGRPMQAWRSFLGWRHSWLSREVLALGAFSTFAAVLTVATWLDLPHMWLTSLSAATVMTGIAGVFTSVMVYADTGREFWELRRTAARFFGTSLVLGAAAAYAACSLTNQPHVITAACALAVLSILKIASEAALRLHLRDEGLTSLKRSALLMMGELGAFHRTRIVFGLLGGVALPLAGVVFGGNTTLAVLAFGICLIGELCERHLFFTAVAPAKMPGHSAERRRS
jgi:Fe-S-cluster-containing dehydrogenase component/DMSO reductase anchor subunit